MMAAVVMDALTTPEQPAALPADNRRCARRGRGGQSVGSFAGGGRQARSGRFGRRCAKRWAHPLLLACRCWVCWCVSRRPLTRARRGHLWLVSTSMRGAGAGS